MAGCKFDTSIDGFIKKGAECEYMVYCSKSGVRCGHDSFGNDQKFHCGYCKSFRMIDALRKAKGEKPIV